VDTWATVAVAIGTLGAVAYALFRDLVLVRRRRPQLELRFDAASSDRVVFGSDEAHVRLRLSNGRGKDTADDVVVIVTELRRLEPDEATFPIGLPLAWWSGSTPQLAVASVHPGSERHLDLLFWPGDAALRLDVAPQPATNQHVLAAGSYEVHLEVRARNADAARYTVALEWDGEPPAEDEPWEHLRVEPPMRRP
jgi:hypothetical protein